MYKICDDVVDLLYKLDFLVKNKVKPRMTVAMIIISTFVKGFLLFIYSSKNVDKLLMKNPTY